jgi:voltage-gated potassium channel
VKAQKASSAASSNSLRRHFYEILEQGAIGHRTGVVVNRFLMLLIVVNLAAVTLESVPVIGAEYRAWFGVIEAVSLVVFTIEYLLRIWIAPEHAPHAHLSD